MDPNATSGDGPPKPKVPRFGVPMGGFALPILPAHKQRAPSIDPDSDAQATVSSSPPAQSSVLASSPPASSPPPMPAPVQGTVTSVPGGRAGAPPPLPRAQQPAQSVGPPPMPQQPAASTVPPHQPATQAQAPAGARPPPSIQQQAAQPTPAAARAPPPQAVRAPPPMQAAPVPAAAPVVAKSAPPPLPPPQTEQEQEVAKSMLVFLLEELSPSVFTRKKDALDTFEGYYFKIYPAYSAQDIRALYFGCTPNNPQEKGKGMFALCGATSWKHSGLKKAAAQSLGLLAKLCDKEASPHAQMFASAFVGQDHVTLRMLRLDKHLATARGNRHAAQFLLNLLKVFKYDVYESVQKDLAQTAPEEVSELRNLKRDHLAKRISMRSTDPNILKKKQAYGGGGLAPINEKGGASSSSSPAISNSHAAKEKSSITSRLLAFFGAGRPTPQELEKKGLIKSKSFGVALEELYKNPCLIEKASTSFNGEVMIPSVLKTCCEHMVSAGIIQLQGVFRLSGDSVEISGIKEKFDVGAVIDLHKVGPHSVSGLVKLFLRLLPQPLLCFENYDELVSTFRSGEFAKIDNILQSNLPKSHFQTFIYLMDFLSKVNSYQEINMMSDTNISICIAPNILRPKVETYEKVAKDTPITIGVVKYLIGQHAEKMHKAGLLPLGGPSAGGVQQPAAQAPAAQPADMPGQPMPQQQQQAAAQRAVSPVPAAQRATSPVPVGSSSSAAERAASPARFAISPPVSPRGARAVEEYSSTSAEAIQAAREQAAREPVELDADGKPIEQKQAFVPTTAQFDLANAMAAAMANRGALKPRVAPATGSSSASASTSTPAPAAFALKKVTPPAGAGGPSTNASGSAAPPVVPAVQLKKVEPRPPPRRASMKPVPPTGTTEGASLVGAGSSGQQGSGLGSGGKRGSILAHGHGHSPHHSHSATPIPEHFQRFTDPTSGKHYYHNTLTGKVTWRKPDCIVDALDETDAKQVFPPPIPTESPPPDSEDSFVPPQAPGVPDSPMSSSTHSILPDSPAPLATIVPAPPKQPRRTSSMFGSGPLLPPPPVPTEQPPIVEESEDEDEDDIPVPSEAPPVPTDLPPPFDDDMDDSIPVDLPPPPPGFVDAQLPPAPVAPAPAAAAPAPAPVKDEDPDLPPPPFPEPAAASTVPAAAAPVPPAVPAYPAPSQVSVPSTVPPPVPPMPASLIPPAAATVTAAEVPPSVPVPPSTAPPPMDAEDDDDDDEVEEDAEWEEFADPVSGKAYFYNKKTDQTTWTNPFKGVASTEGASGGDASVVSPTPAAPVGPSVPATLTHSSSSFPSPLYGGWDCVEIHGRWDEKSAQGCYPNFSGWSKNPQYHVGIVAPKDGSELKGKTQVVIQLQWSNLSRINGLVDGEDSGVNSIAGFYVLLNNGPSYQKLFIHADDILSRSEFEKDGSVSVNLLLDSFSQHQPGSSGEPFVRNYVLIPSTFEPGYTGDFTITIHSASATWIAPVVESEKWLETGVTSQWLGDTAGGCRNHAATFPLNPQFSLTSSTPSTPVLVLLTQHVPPGGTVHPIGFYAINQSGKIEAKGAFQANVEVHALWTCVSASGPYVLVPCTFAPGLEAKFTLSVFAPPGNVLQLTPIPRA